MKMCLVRRLLLDLPIHVQVNCSVEIFLHIVQLLKMYTMCCQYLIVFGMNFLNDMYEQFLAQNCKVI